MSTYPQKIVVKGEENCLKFRGKAGEAIKPGMTLKWSTTVAGTVLKNTLVADTIPPLIMIAQEDVTVGEGVFADTTTPTANSYATGDEVPFIVPAPGTIVELLLGDSQSIALGDWIVLATGGLHAELATAASEVRIGVAIEAAESSTSNVSVFAKVMCC